MKDKIDENNVMDILLYKDNVSEGKRKILTAAVELFYEQGFDKTATSQISQCAGVSEGAIYKHFHSKQELLNSIINPLVSNILFICKHNFTINHSYTDKNIEKVITTTILNDVKYIYTNRKIIKILIVEILTNNLVYNEIKEIYDSNHFTINDRISNLLQEKDASKSEFLRILISDLIYEFFKIILYNECNEKQLECDAKKIVSDILNYVV